MDIQLAEDGSLYYLARGLGSTTGVVYRIAYNSIPRIDFIANGQDGPVTLTSGTPLQIEWSFDAGPSGSLNAAEINWVSESDIPSDTIARFDTTTIAFG